ncbi:pyridoxal phosphate-dependent aminotransferase [Rhizosphaericola mali]|uniref:Histidinol-phosphate aminotransferase family protein n=1 Tax=Rhizosphaericola mali TaxID=2545455 RepID=A0A5P2G8J0_9BACT|nr:histidinol-phosphate transaminase [Rhizosphaericola mali]QES89533.1 histidinol-phosphate aminotransferase family protein [Rhizosphaericola mali]
MTTETQLDRRRWIKNSALLTGGLAFGTSFFTSLKKASAAEIKETLSQSFLTDNLIAMETTPPEIKARLSANENPFGPSASAKEAIQKSIDKSYQYAFYEGREMSKKIADFEGLSSDNLLLSAGSSPILQAGAILYGKGTIVSSKPTYEDLLSTAESMGTKVLRLPLTSDYKFDLDAIEKAVDSNTSLVYICNPNNPTATIVDSNKLREFCKRVSKKTMIFVDEAYIDLVENPAETTMIPLIKEGYNIIITRTFSKLYGMAGMRFGYMIGQPATIKKFEQITPGSMSVANATWAAALVSYQDKPFMKMSYDGIQTSKKYLYDALKKEGYEYVPSDTNFLVFPVKEDSKKFVMNMMKYGVSVRSWEFNDKQWCRVSIGTLEEMKTFALALAKVS